MKTSHRLALVFIIFAVCHGCYAQTTAPSVAPSPAVQISPTPCPPTSIKISTTGLELVGFQTWIIWLVLGVAVVAFVVWFFLLRSEKASFWSAAIPAVVVIIGVMVLLLMIGDWWGRRGARAELRDMIAARGPTIEIPTPQPALVSQTNAGNASQGSSWPLYIGLVMGFALLIGIEVAVFKYIHLRWGSKAETETNDLGGRLKQLHYVVDRLDSHLHRELYDLRRELGLRGE